MDPKYFDQIKEARKTADLVKKIQNDEIIVLDDENDLILLTPELEAELTEDELKDTAEMYLDELLMEEAADNPECNMQICSMARQIFDTAVKKKLHKTAETVVKLQDGWTLEDIVAGGPKQFADFMEDLVGEDNLPSILNQKDEE
jgi:hypothetical protein